METQLTRPFDKAQDAPLTPQEQAERERLQRILDDLNGQIDSIVAEMEAGIALAIRAAAQKSLRPAIRKAGLRSLEEKVR